MYKVHSICNNFDITFRFLHNLAARISQLRWVFCLDEKGIELQLDIFSITRE